MSDIRAPRRLTLGIDLGTSAVKVVAMGLDDAVLGEGAAGFGTDCTLPGQAEQRQSDWLRSASAAMHMLADRLRESLGADWSEHVEAIGLTGQLPTLVCLDEAKPLGEAIDVEGWSAPTPGLPHASTRRIERSCMPAPACPSTAATWPPCCSITSPTA